ncbi:hypothetical protein GCM10010486_71130 [Nonomuraea roseoviolacea subsp. carminata]
MPKGLQSKETLNLPAANSEPRDLMTGILSAVPNTTFSEGYDTRFVCHTQFSQLSPTITTDDGRKTERKSYVLAFAR